MVFADSARGFMILLMLVGHTDPPKLLFKLIYGFHMPFFFLLSGYLFDAEKYARMRFGTYCKMRFVSYMIPYFFYAFCNLLLNIPLEIRQGITGKALAFSTAKHVLWILYAVGDKTRLPNCTPLWFLPCLFVCCLLFYGLRRMPKQPLQ
ncbi:MAG: acyltransferase family protein [Clostridia bacterium]|nr:acyltransferase family protein [Clostridia bacterium]